MTYQSGMLYERSKSFDASAGAYADPDGIKTSIAAAASIQTYLPAYNGTSTVGKAIATGAQDSFVSWPSVTNTSQSGKYIAASTIVFTGTYGGVVTTRTAALTTANGGETVVADGPLDHGSITSIVVAAQVDTAGAFTFGWTGVGPKKGYAWHMVAREAGSYHVGHSDGGDDTLALPAHGEHLAAVNRIYGDVTLDVTVYEIARP
jgi:hypothetical protein